MPTLEKAREEAARIGFPLLCKARSGGGGRGIRLVREMKEFDNAYRTASAEAEAAFGDGGVYLERFLTHTKHCLLYTSPLGGRPERPLVRRGGKGISRRARH